MKRTIFKSYLTVEEVSTPKGIIRERISPHDAVAAVVYHPELKKYFFIKQWRPGKEDYILELPAGKIDHQGESPLDTIRREIIEETGYDVSFLRELYKFYVSPGTSSEQITLYYAEISEKLSDEIGVEDEDLELVLLNETEIKTTKFDDGKTILGLLKLNLLPWKV